MQLVMLNADTLKEKKGLYWGKLWEIGLDRSLGMENTTLSKKKSWVSKYNLEISKILKEYESEVTEASSSKSEKFVTRSVRAFKMGFPAEYRQWRNRPEVQATFLQPKI